MWVRTCYSTTLLYQYLKVRPIYYRGKIMYSWKQKYVATMAYITYCYHWCFSFLVNRVCTSVHDYFIGKVIFDYFKGVIDLFVLFSFTVTMCIKGSKYCICVRAYKILNVRCINSPKIQTIYIHVIYDKFLFLHNCMFIHNGARIKTFGRPNNYKADDNLKNKR